MPNEPPVKHRWRDLIWTTAAKLLRVSSSQNTAVPAKGKNNHHWTLLIWTTLAAASVYAWIFAGQGSQWRTILIAGASLSSFMVGCLVAFLFTSYGEESPTVGKVRDWLIGGLTGLTVAKAAEIKAFLLTFAAGPGPSEFALVAGAAITYAILGFFFMFFQRELILNVLLAASRAERLKLEGSGAAGRVLQRVLAALPPSLLSGVDNVDDSARFRKKEAEKLRVILYSMDVQKFLDDCDDALKSGRSLDWDVVSKAANLHYYRTYFEKDEQQFAQASLANSWITRALNLNPLHVDFTVKYADTLGMMDRYDEAAAILERLERTPDAPAYVEQWLGYFLLFVDRPDDAIKYSEAYHARFPHEFDSVFNIACAYAQKYCEELRQTGQSQNLDSENRRRALTRLREALRSEPEYEEIVRTKWTEPGDSFDCFLHDREFRALVHLSDESTADLPGGDAS
jgi:tetratricopeptide (TPR) repeat protein